MENRVKGAQNITKNPKKTSTVGLRPALGELGNKLQQKCPVNNIADKKPIKTLKNAENTIQSINNVKEKVSYSSKQILDIYDPDANDNNNPLLVTEYVKDIYEYLLTLESKYTIEKDYLNNHQTTCSMRKVLVKWMIEVQVNFTLLAETLQMAIGILDRYLQLNKNVSSKTLQLVGTTAIIIAGKYEEIFMPDLREFIYICDHTFTMEQFLKMEEDILVNLKFNLGRPLPSHFLRRYSKIASVNMEHHNLAKYLLEICLLEYKLCHLNPSLQAAASCCLSISILNNVYDLGKIWTKTLAHYSTYKHLELKPVITTLACSLKAIQTSNSHCLKKKYASSLYGKISCHHKLDGPIIKKLVEYAGISKKI